MAANIKRIRKARSLTTEELSGRLTAVGRPILATGLTSIETGRRRVDVDDLMALAIALRVSPLTLLMPNTDDVDGVVGGVREVTGAGANVNALWEWAIGAAPLPAWGVPDPDADSAAMAANYAAVIADFQLHAVPARYRRLKALVTEMTEQYEKWKTAEPEEYQRLRDEVLGEEEGTDGER